MITLIENNINVGILTGEETGESLMQSTLASINEYTQFKRTYEDLAGDFHSMRVTRQDATLYHDIAYYSTKLHYLTGVSASASVHLLGVLTPA